MAAVVFAYLTKIAMRGTSSALHLLHEVNAVIAAHLDAPEETILLNKVIVNISHNTWTYVSHDYYPDT